jgi:hypothetical protein
LGLRRNFSVIRKTKSEQQFAKSIADANCPNSHVPMRGGSWKHDQSVKGEERIDLIGMGACRLW